MSIYYKTTISNTYINDSSLISLYSNGSKISDFESFNDAHVFMSSYNFIADTILEINNNTTISLTSSVFINYDNGDYNFTLRGKTGRVVIFDGGSTLNTLIVSNISNITIQNLTLQNAGLTASDGAILRQNPTTNNITFKNIQFKYGYCAIRATTTITNLTIEDCYIESTYYGSFRLGNPPVDDPEGAEDDFDLRDQTFYDMWNLSIRNIVLNDTYDKGLITGSDRKFDGSLVIKRTYNLVIDNVYCNNTSSSVLYIQNNYNTTINRISCQAFGTSDTANNMTQGIYLNGQDVGVVSNVCTLGNADGYNKNVFSYAYIRNVRFYHNTFVAINNLDTPFGGTDGMLFRLKGNVFKSLGGINPCTIQFTLTNGYTPSIAQDVLEEDYNVFCSAGNFSTNLQFRDKSSAPTLTVSVRNNTGTNIILPATYRSTYNLGTYSLFPITTSTQLESINGSVANYLTNTSIGRDIVSSIIGTVSRDIYNNVRTFPTDAGATDRDII